ncbi:MAG TPA: ABC transporter permease [Chloroflexota bacterium]
MSSSEAALYRSAPRSSGRRRGARTQWLLPLTGLGAGLLAWQLLTLPGSWPLANAFSPASTLAALVRMVGEGVVWPHLEASLVRIFAGLGLAAVAGIPLGVWIGRSHAAEVATSGIFQFLRMVSPLSWMPIAVMALGVGDRPVVFLVAIAAVWPILLNTAHGISAVDRRWVRAARALGAQGRAVLWRVLLPAALPNIVTGVRLALGTAWIVLVPAEMLGVHSGLGYFILDTRDRFAYGELLATLLVIGAVGYGLDLLLRGLRSRVGWE